MRAASKALLVRLEYVWETCESDEGEVGWMSGGMFW